MPHCKRHGEITEDECYVRSSPRKNHGRFIKIECKKCHLLSCQKVKKKYKTRILKDAKSYYKTKQKHLKELKTAAIKCLIYIIFLENTLNS